MGRIRASATLVTLVLVAAACTGNGEVTPPDASPSSPAPAPSSPPATASPSPAPSPSATTPSAASCDDEAVLATVDASVAAARLAPVTAWSADVADNRFATRTVTGAAFARGLGFDCGLLRSETIGADDERLVVAAWTGPRMAWVVQTSESPTTPYAPEAAVTVVIDDTEGEFLDDAGTTWAGTLDSGETFVVGHVDFNLGAAAKGWVAEVSPPDDDDDGDGGDDDGLAAERHGIEVLEAAGMREVDIAQPAQVGSEEGYLQFVSPTGQISVADVAPTGWFDPMVPRYYTGETSFSTIEGTRVRTTRPGPDAPDYAIAVEVGFACDAFVWLLEPPMNGDADEMRASAAAILATDACRG